MLRVERLNAWYGASHVLQDLSLEVNRGEIVCLIGRNGAQIHQPGVAPVKQQAGGGEHRALGAMRHTARHHPARRHVVIALQAVVRFERVDVALDLVRRVESAQRRFFARGQQRGNSPRVISLRHARSLGMWRGQARRLGRQVHN